MWLNNFFKTLVFLVFSGMISLSFLLVLPFYQYYMRGGVVAKTDQKREKIRVVPINLSKKVQKQRKLRVKSQKPKISQASARSDRFKLDLASSGANGVAMGASDTADIIYDQNEVDSLPVRLKGRAPEMTRAFSISAQKGLVELELVIEVDGSVSRVTTVKEEPKGYGLAAMATTAIRSWKFRPALLNGIPVRLKVIQPFGF